MTNTYKITFVSSEDHSKQYEHISSASPIGIGDLMRHVCEKDELLYVAFGESPTIEVRTACVVAASASKKWKLYINAEAVSLTSPGSNNRVINPTDTIVWRLEEADPDDTVPQSIRAVFAEFSRVADDRIDLEGLRQFFQKMDIHLSTESLQEMMNYADTSGRGIGLADFAQVWGEQEL